MRIATWNVNSVTARLPRVVDWLQQTGTDVLCLQETKVADTAFPALPLEEIGYESAHFGRAGRRRSRSRRASRSRAPGRSGR